MAFTVNEFRDLLNILRTKPEWKAELRRELLGDKILELPRLVRELTQYCRRDESAKVLRRVRCRRVQDRQCIASFGFGCSQVRFCNLKK